MAVKATPKELNLSESEQTASLNLVPFFTKTPQERIVYTMEVLPASFASMVSLNRESGSLNVRFTGNVNPTLSANTRVVSGNLVTSYTIQAYAVNQWNKRSPALVIPVRETVVATPVFNSGNWPREIHIHNRQTTQEINLVQSFTDPQNLPLTFQITSGGGSSWNITLSKEGRLRVTSSQRTQQTTITITISNGRKQVTQSIPIIEEWVQPPELISSPSSSYSINPTTPLRLTLANHFRDHSANQSLRVTGGNTTLAFSVTASPASAMNGVISGGVLNITSKDQDASFRVTITATNTYGLSRTAEFTVQDRKKTDCVVSAFGDWGSCNKSCGGGTQTRTRRIITQDTGGGVSCSTFPLEESRSCNTQSCAIPCQFRVISQGECDAPCGQGTQDMRYSIIAQPQNGGEACPTDGRKPCHTGITCPGIGVRWGWSHWTNQTQFVLSYAPTDDIVIAPGWNMKLRDPNTGTRLTYWAPQTGHAKYGKHWVDNYFRNRHNLQVSIWPGSSAVDPHNL